MTQSTTEKCDCLHVTYAPTDILQQGRMAERWRCDACGAEFSRTKKWKERLETVVKQRNDAHKMLEILEKSLNEFWIEQEH